MKGLNKIALVAAIAAASSAQAELVAMDDASMSAATGQAGLTIDVNSANISIGEINWKDADATNPTEGGSVFITGFKMGGAGLVEIARGAAPGATHNNATLDNLRINIDVAGAGEDFSSRYGIGKVGAGPVIAFKDAYTGKAGSNAEAIAFYDTTLVSDGAGGTVQVNEITDGDMVIGLDAQDQTTIVDFGMIIGQVSLGDSSMGAGSSIALASADGRTTTDGRTVLMAATALGGGIGPVDIIIDGQDGGMNINAHFQLKGAMEFPFVATKMGFFLHNSRGLNSLVATGIQYDDGSAAALTGAFANVTIGKADVDGDGVADGLRFDVNRFEGDMDMTNITLGDAPTIGSLYITDMKVSANMVVYGH